MRYCVALTRHPETSCEAVRGIEAHVSWGDDGALAFIYVLKGDLDRLRIPPPGPRRRTDELWRHTCFEAFVGVKGVAAYREFNFAPSGEWAVYDFQRYRTDGQFVDEGPAPQIAMRATSDSLELRALVGGDLLPVFERGGRLKLALCAVIEEESGVLSYWALNYPPGKPDFHHAAAFALEIERPAKNP